MYSSISDLVNSFRGRGRAQRVYVSLELEALEERCVLSADTTVPAVNPLDPAIGAADVFMASLPKGTPSVVFLGDSITWGFAYGSGAPIWSAVLAPLGAVDYGIPGQTTQSLLYQLSQGQLSGTQPSMVVLTIGTNNMLEGDSPQATAAGILADVQAIHALLPQTQILVLGTPPGAYGPFDSYRIEVNQTDALVSQSLVGDSRATFVNIAPAFEQGDGSISPAVLSDSIHPTEQGYINWMALLLPRLPQATFIPVVPFGARLDDIFRNLAASDSIVPPPQIHGSGNQLMLLPSDLKSPTNTTLPSQPPASTPTAAVLPTDLPSSTLGGSDRAVTPVEPSPSTNTTPPADTPPVSAGSVFIPPTALDYLEETHALVVAVVRATTWASSNATAI
jgi:platelet-activating factor acetylhydrolase IB subunit beta/gamma